MVREAAAFGLGKRSSFAPRSAFLRRGAAARGAVLAAHIPSMGMVPATLKERLTGCRWRRARRRTAIRRQSATRDIERPARAGTGRRDSPASGWPAPPDRAARSEEHTSELQSPCNLVCRLLLEKKKT